MYYTLVIVICFFFHYRNPDECCIKEKMIYSASKDAFKKFLNFTALEVQANDEDDLCWGSVLEKLLKNEVAQ